MSDSIGSTLTGRKQTVEAESAESSHLFISNGVPQGSVLGPLPLTLYINIILPNQYFNVYFFADDTILYATDSTLLSAFTYFFTILLTKYFLIIDLY